MGALALRQQPPQQAARRTNTVLVTCKNTAVRQAALRNKRALRNDGRFARVYVDEALSQQQRAEKKRLMPTSKQAKQEQRVVTWRGAELWELAAGPPKRWTRVQAP
jgi:hypothetical protein